VPPAMSAIELRARNSLGGMWPVIATCEVEATSVVRR
jgi:hypothetical protein